MVILSKYTNDISKKKYFNYKNANKKAIQDKKTLHIKALPPLFYQST